MPYHRPRLKTLGGAVAVVTALVGVVAGLAAERTGARKPIQAQPRATATARASAAPAQPRAQLDVNPAPFRLPAPVERAVAVAWRSQILIAGGLDAAGRSAAGVFALDPAGGRLRLLGALPLAFHDGAGALIGGRLYVFGGGVTTSSDAVQAFDPRTGRGGLVGRLPRPLSDLAAAQLGGTTYLVGGFDGSRPRPEILATRDGRRFMLAARLPVGLRYPAVTVASGTLLIAGGQTATGLSAAVYAFDPATRRVRLLTSRTAPVAHAAALAAGHTLYVLGGADAAGATTGSIGAVDLETRASRRLARSIRPRADAAGAQLDGTTFLIGGRRQGQPLATVLELRTGPPVATARLTPAQRVGLPPVEAGPVPGYVLIADRDNNRIVVVSPSKRVVWRFPRPGDLRPGQSFSDPDDAFFAPGYRAITTNEEFNQQLGLIDIRSRRLVWTYGHAGVRGSAPGYLANPDDAYRLANGLFMVADIENCRVLFVDRARRIVHELGHAGGCRHDPPRALSSPNGATPLPDGGVLVTEIGGWVDLIDPRGKLVYSVRTPTTYPSDAQLLPGGNILVAGFDTPGRVDEITPSGRIVWTFAPSGYWSLDRPSLAARWPNGMIAITDDWHHRVLVVDPHTKRVVWSYGRLDRPGSAPGYLDKPDGLDLLPAVP